MTCEKSLEIEKSVSDPDWKPDPAFRDYNTGDAKSAGQLLYEKTDGLGRIDPVTGREDTPLPPWWSQLSAKDQKRWEFNATVTPKAQTIKAP